MFCFRIMILATYSNDLKLFNICTYVTKQKSKTTHSHMLAQRRQKVRLARLAHQGEKKFLLLRTMQTFIGEQARIFYLALVLGYFHKTCLKAPSFCLSFGALRLLSKVRLPPAFFFKNLPFFNCSYVPLFLFLKKILNVTTITCIIANWSREI